MPAPAPRRHPEHDALAAAVDSFDHDPVEVMGYRAERRELGTFWDLDLIRTAGFDPSRAAELVADGVAFYDGRPFTIHLSAPVDDDELDRALVAVGARRGDDVNLSLAHVGSLPPLPDVAGVPFVTVDSANLAAAAEAKVRAFADDESDVDARLLAFELGLRRRELEGIGRGRVAIVDDEVAAVLFCYDDASRPAVLVHLLGTRVPYRGRRLGERLLAECVHRAHASARAAVINVFASNEGAVRLYRRMGFVDVVARRRIYRYDPSG